MVGGGGGGSCHEVGAAFGVAPAAALCWAPRIDVQLTDSFPYLCAQRKESAPHTAALRRMAAVWHAAAPPPDRAHAGGGGASGGGATATTGRPQPRPTPFLPMFFLIWTGTSRPSAFFPRPLPDSYPMHFAICFPKTSNHLGNSPFVA